MQVEAVWHPSFAQVMLSSQLRRLFAEMTSRISNGPNCNVVHRLRKVTKLDKRLQSHQTNGTTKDCKRGSHKIVFFYRASEKIP